MMISGDGGNRTPGSISPNLQKENFEDSEHLRNGFLGPVQNAVVRNYDSMAKPIDARCVSLNIND